MVFSLGLCPTRKMSLKQCFKSKKETRQWFSKSIIDLYLMAASFNVLSIYILKKVGMVFGRDSLLAQQGQSLQMLVCSWLMNSHKIISLLKLND